MNVTEVNDIVNVSRYVMIVPDPAITLRAHLLSAGKPFQPDVVRLDVAIGQDGARRMSARVSGPRVLNDGRLSESTRHEACFYDWERGTGWPKWLAEIALDYAPEVTVRTAVIRAHE